MAELASLIRQQEWEAMLRNAHLIRNAPEGPERTAAARELIYRAMYEAALRQITQDQRHQLLAILQPCCPDLFYSASAFHDEASDLQDTPGNPPSDLGEHGDLL
jgi:hypothetical protein